MKKLLCFLMAISGFILFGILLQCLFAGARTPAYNEFNTLQWISHWLWYTLLVALAMFLVEKEYED